MAYFKTGNVVVRSDSAPLTINGELKFIHKQGVVVVGDSVTGHEDDIYGLITNNLVPWEEATELEYLQYCSLKLNLISFASREIRSKIWALNEANESFLRIGGNYPLDKASVKITQIRDKIQIIALTQHWYSGDLPSMTKDNNSTWSRWIIKKRRQEAFVYLGGVIDTIGRP